ncbi:hypothetical protein [Jiella marina]|uniref:hypothetical protein n=1 Tax=Jiella sp. LLJ827 TaxID=2917712 RepID=UPI002100B0EA|nr:hypothetical protein [Jiella sp. LLJ827]MCQ0989614.1 hypothetical protein [Jiella sp. LLJ827]
MNYERLFSEIRAQSETRHDIVHGILLKRAEGADSHQLIRFLHGGMNLNQKEINITTRTILSAAKDAEELAGRVFKWVNEASLGIAEFFESNDKKTR